MATQNMPINFLPVVLEVRIHIAIPDFMIIFKKVIYRREFID